jgi:hypothetical protein
VAPLEQDDVATRPGQGRCHRKPGDAPAHHCDVAAARDRSEGGRGVGGHLGQERSP